jgi:hypothetical protein
MGGKGLAGVIVRKPVHCHTITFTFLTHGERRGLREAQEKLYTCQALHKLGNGGKCGALSHGRCRLEDGQVTPRKFQVRLQVIHEPRHGWGKVLLMRP